MAVELYVLRHGRSLANEANLIVSSLDNGMLPQYGLAPAGKEQAAAAGRQLAAAVAARDDDDAAGAAAAVVHFYASPFSRTVETAAIAAEAFEQALEQERASPAAAGARRAGPPEKAPSPAAAGARLAGPPETEPALRERWFGTALELEHHDGYSPAWENDARDPTSRPPGEGDGESVAEVAARAAGLLARLAERHGGNDGEASAAAAGVAVVVLVSHGDTLSILQAAANGEPLQEHRRFGLGTAELKRVGPLAEAARRAARWATAAAVAP